VVKGKHVGATRLLEKLRDRFQVRFGIKIAAYLPFESDRGASIHKVGTFHRMLMFPKGFQQCADDILEIELHLFTWGSFVLRLVLAFWVLRDAPGLLQNLPEGCLRAGKARSCGLEGGVAMQILQNGFGTWRPP
jgi:hypothetical protein